MTIKKRRRSASTEKEPLQKRQEARSQGPKAGSSPDTHAPAPIRKGIYLSALIYVEGDQPPAENFDPVAIGALRDVLSPTLKEERDGLKMTLKSIDVRNDIEQEDEEEGKEEQGKEKGKE